jgi:hypothetical protein
MSVRTRQIAVFVAALLLLLPTGVALAKPTMTAPATARVGETIHVSAHGLTRARNAVTLVLDGTVGPRIVCVARLARAAKPSTSISVDVKIPDTLVCLTNGIVRVGTRATRPGRYHIFVARPTALGAFTSEPAKRPIRIVRGG